MPLLLNDDPGLTLTLREPETDIGHDERQLDAPRNPEPIGPRGWRRLGFVVVNLWLIFHLFAIIVCPASVDPSSPLLQSGFSLVAPYLHLLYMDHGFHFFAPEPGASTLVSYRLELPDGSTQTGQLPNRKIFPRLLYHRHFMLTEFLGNGPEELQPLVERALARNLCRQSGAVQVTLTKVEHATAAIDEIRRGLTLNEPSSFTETILGTYTTEELARPMTTINKGAETVSDVKTPDQPPEDVP